MKRRRKQSIGAKFTSERLFMNQGLLKACYGNLHKIANSKSTLPSEKKMLDLNILPRLLVMLTEWRNPTREKVAKRHYLENPNA